MEPEKTPLQPKPANPNDAAPNIANTLSGLQDAGIEIVGEASHIEAEQPQAPESPAPQAAPAPKPASPAQAPQPVRQARPEEAFVAPQSKPIVLTEMGDETLDVDVNRVDHRNDPSIKPLRTFKTDAEEAVRYQNMSIAHIAVAEQQRKEAGETKPIQPSAFQFENEGPKKSSLPLIILLLLVVALGGGGYYYWFYMRVPAGETPSTAATSSAPAAETAPRRTVPVSTIIPYTVADAIAVDPANDPISAMGLRLASTTLQLNDVYALVPVIQGTTTSVAPIASVLGQTHIPDMLKRSLADSYMIGERQFDKTAPFIILKNTFFQNAFAGMLQWEKDMRNDLISVIHVAYPDEPTVSANVDVFSDTVVSNIDTRVLRNQDGTPVLMYAFADKDTIVITTDAATLKFILDQLLTVRVVQ